ncbi:MAG: hypothetical protein ACJAVP_002941 [Spirosomataceae bacterium]|jgi:hypothetical protein
MNNDIHNLPNGSGKNNGKINHKATQLQTIFEYLQSHVCTATMLSKATGVPQKCITRYKRDLEKAGNLAEVFKTYCKDTNNLAWYITCDRSKFPPPSQLNLFEA